jgi:hypothetical protein
MEKKSRKMKRRIVLIISNMVDRTINGGSDVHLSAKDTSDVRNALFLELLYEIVSHLLAIGKSCAVGIVYAIPLLISAIEREIGYQEDGSSCIEK